MAFQTLCTVSLERSFMRAAAGRRRHWIGDIPLHLLNAWTKELGVL
jgi:hypothetical protein